MGVGAGTAEVTLWSLWRSVRDRRARAELIARHLPYARIVAATYYRRRRHDEIEFDDYLQHARLGMLEAMERFDPDRGVLFETFAARRMHGAILDGLECATEKQQQIAVRARLAQPRSARTGPHRSADDGDALFREMATLGIGVAVCTMLEGTGMAESLGSVERTEDEPSHRSCERAQLRRHLELLVAELPPQQRVVIRHHYLQEQPFHSIADGLQVSRGRVSQIHRIALTTLHALLEESA
jgi:RNA polymerase sigma factor for flagellar operon FliA